LYWASDCVIGLGALAARLGVWHFFAGRARGESTAPNFPQ
jgi:hypothetical protein